MDQLDKLFNFGFVKHTPAQEPIYARAISLTSKKKNQPFKKPPAQKHKSQAAGDKPIKPKSRLKAMTTIS